MNPYIWCGVGAVIGWLASRLTGSADLAVTIENVCVGIFGAFIGGGVAGDTSFHISSLGIAVASSVAMLFALKLMRRTVGPMRHGKSKTKQRY